MNTKIKLLVFLFVTMLFFTLSSCEKDLYENNIKRDSKFHYERLTGEKARQVALRLIEVII